MRIRFETKDRLEVVHECPNFRVPPAYIDRPIPLEHVGTKNMCRRYEYRGEVRNGIPTLHEL